MGLLASTEERYEFWSGIRSLRTSAPTTFNVLAFWLLLELMAITMLPLWLADHQYLRIYLSDRAEEKTKLFARDSDPFLMWDDILGWRGRPNSGRAKWHLNAEGIRVSSAYGAGRRKPLRVAFIGNSLTNGSMQVTNDETISSFLESDNVESLNFATMLYSVDQMVLSYKALVRPHDPDLVVMGIGGSPTGGLTSRYIPFWQQSETNIPLIKPRFYLASDSLELIPPSSRKRFGSILVDDAFLHEVRDTDGYYGRFEDFKCFQMLPMSSIIYKLVRKAINLRAALAPTPAPQMDLLRELIRQSAVTMSKDGVEFVVMLLPDKESSYPSHLKGQLKDRYAETLAMLQELDLRVLDVRHVLRLSDVEPSELYSTDGIHFTPMGNKLIAESLDSIVKAIVMKVGTRNQKER